MRRTISAIALRSLFVATVPAILGAAQSAGADTFKDKCAMCHGANGSSQTPLEKQFKIPDLRSPEVQKRTDGELTSTITTGKPPMPPFGESLSSENIRELMEHIRSMATKK